MNKHHNTKCQVFTPVNYVSQLLDLSDYNRNIIDKCVLENSCGDGNILQEVVKRYIIDGIRKKKSRDDIRFGLESNIYGVEIDKRKLCECKNKLDIEASKHGVYNVSWNLVHCDYLRWKTTKKFDYIIGNPPYINYSEIEDKDIQYIKSTFNCCKKGKFDYYYAFIEKSLDDLEQRGCISYLIPSSFFKTVSGEDIRKNILPCLKKIIDFSQENIFKDALVKSSAILIDKGIQHTCFSYVSSENPSGKLIQKKFMGSKWIFNDIKKGKYRFGDYYRVSHVVATLSNEVFVFQGEKHEDEDFFYFNNIVLEKGLIHQGSSPKGLRKKQEEWIIFPYQCENGKVERMTDSYFKDNYPKIFLYLQSQKEKLDKRKKEKTCAWFEYGRSQALDSIHQKKLLVSTIVTEKVEVYQLGSENIPYGGMYIVPIEKNGNAPLEKAIDILKSENFLNYVKNIGVAISGSSFRITSKDIENYTFDD